MRKSYRRGPKPGTHYKPVSERLTGNGVGKRLGLWMRPEDFDRLTKEAGQQGISVAELSRRLIISGLGA